MTTHPITRPLTRNITRAITEPGVGGGEPDPYGPELIANGGFDSGASWAVGTNWTIASGKATKTGATTGALAQTLGAVLEAGESYEMVFTVLDYTAGQVRGSFSGGGGGVVGTYRTANGTYTQTLVATFNHTNFSFQPTTDFGGAVDVVSLRKIL